MNHSRFVAVLCALLASALCATLLVHPAWAQGQTQSSAQRLGVPTPEGVSPTVKSRPEGKNTVKTETWSKTDESGLTEQTTVTTVTDENGNTLSQTGNLTMSAGSGVRYTVDVTDAYNALGGRDRTIKTESHGPYATSSEEHETYDAADRMLSHDSTTTYHDASGRATSVSKSQVRREYNADGSYSQTLASDATENGKPEHDEFTGTYDAQGHMQSGELKITKPSDEDGSPETSTWKYDPTDQHLHPISSATPLVPPLDSDPRFTSVVPQPGSAPGTDGITLPPSAGASSEIVLTVDTTSPDAQAGAGGVLLLTVDQTGNQRVYRASPQDGRLSLPAAVAGGVLKTIEILKGFDDLDRPIVASRCDIGNPAHIAGTQPVANVPPSGPAISEATPSTAPGSTMTLHIQGNDPDTTQFALGGRQLQPLAVSDNSAVVRVDPAATLGHQQLVMQTGSTRTAPLTISVVKLIPHPLAPMHPGVTETVTVEVAGLTPDDQATMDFALGSDVAEIAGGGATRTVPVTDGRAELPIVGTRAGEVVLRFHLNVKNPQFAGT